MTSEMVTPEVSKEQLIVLARIREVERRDDTQILQAMAGEIVSEYVYSFKDSRGRKRTGLSWAGTKEIAQYRGNIRIDEAPLVTDGGDHWRVMVKAEDLLRNVAVWGGTHQPKKMKVYLHDTKTGDALYDQETGEALFDHQDDDFALEKAISKAQRNAIKNLLPETIIKGLIERYIEADKKGKKRPPATEPEGNAQPLDIDAIDPSKFKSWGEVADTAHKLGILSSEVWARAGKKGWLDFATYEEAWEIVVQLYHEQHPKENSDS